MGEQINLVINNIADKLGVAVDKLYPTLLTQARIDGVMAIVTMVILTIVLIAIVIIVTRIEKYQRHNNEDWQFSDSFFMGFIVVASTLVVGLFWFGELTTAVTALGNPDYYILQNILNQLH